MTDKIEKLEKLVLGPVELLQEGVDGHVPRAWRFQELRDDYDRTTADEAEVLRDALADMQQGHGVQAGEIRRLRAELAAVRGPTDRERQLEAEVAALKALVSGQRSRPSQPGSKT